MNVELRNNLFIGLEIRLDIKKTYSVLAKNQN